MSLFNAFAFSLENTEGSSNKYYNVFIIHETHEVFVEYGRIGQSATIDVKDAAGKPVQKAVELYEEKTRRGYHCVSRIEHIKVRTEFDNVNERFAAQFRSRMKLVEPAKAITSPSELHLELNNSLRTSTPSRTTPARPTPVPHPTTPPPADPDDTEIINDPDATNPNPDDEEFVDDTPAFPGFPPAGESPRPNGSTYLPRSIGGVEDIAFMRHAPGYTLLYGPSGTGKTALIEAAHFPNALPLDTAEAHAIMDRAARLGIRVVPASETHLHYGYESLVCGADTIAEDFLGTFVQDPSAGTYLFWAGPLLRSVLFDVPMYADEVFLCESRVLAATLFEVMDGRGVLRVPLNPTLPPLRTGSRFTVVAAGNPDVPGAVFSDALRTRFTHKIEFGTDWALAKEVGVNKKVVDVAQELDQMRRDGVLSASPQFRELLTFRDSEKLLGLAFATNELLGGCHVEDQDQVREKLQRIHPEVQVLAAGGRHGVQ